MKILFIIILLVTCILLYSCQKGDKKYDLLVTNTHVWTGEAERPWAESFLVSGDTIIQIGTNTEMETFQGETKEVIDAGGKLIVPGFIDSHMHTIMAGYGLSSVKLKNVHSKKEFIQLIEAYAKTIKPGEWILGGDWDHQNWGGELPTHEWIDSVTQKNPVWIERSEGHSGLANQLAMHMAGLSKSTKEISGGIIVRTSEGSPTGILKDDAMTLVFKVIPNPSDAQKEKALNDAMDYLLSEGVTSAHHMVEPHNRNWGGRSTDYETFRKMHDQGKLRVRFYIAEPFTDWKKIADRIQREGKGDKWFKTGALKGYVDGAIGSHSALFYDDYTDQPGFKGSQINSEKFLQSVISSADSAGLQLCIHAIGDKAIHIALSCFDSAISKNHRSDQRFRIEHTQHIAPADIDYLSKSGVIASMQPYHAIDDGIWCGAVIGPERSKTTYAHKSLTEAGAHIAFGSDWWVAPPSPLKGIYAAVTRRTLDGKNPQGWIPEQKIIVEEALHNYTIEGAYASFDEKIKGKLKPGMLADFVILEDNIFKMNPNSIFDAKVNSTFVGGKKMYERTASQKIIQRNH